MSKNPKNEGKNLDNAQLIKEIKGKVQNYYLGKTDGLGELNKEKVLKFMQSDKFLEELNQWYDFNDRGTVNKIVTAVVDKFIQKNKESEDKCADFVDSISNFTNGFSFLVSEYDAYKTIYGNKNSKSLPQISDYNKLLDLKAKINIKMIIEHKTEAEAICDLLHTQKSSIQLDTAELIILRKRIDVINGKINIKSKKENNIGSKHIKSQKIHSINNQETSHKKNLVNNKDTSPKNRSLNKQDASKKPHLFNKQDVSPKKHSVNKQDVSPKKHSVNKQDILPQKHSVSKQDISKKAQPAKKTMSLKEARARLMASQKSSKK